MKKSPLTSVLAGAALAALALAPNTAAAQTASITASAVVQTPLTVTAGTNLAFGNVFPGLPYTVAPTAAGAGTFSLVGQANAQVQLTFNLPANLTSGANSMAITFGANSLIYNVTNSPTGGTATDPSTTPTPRLDGTTGDLFLFIGGSITPAANQPAGTYTGTIQLTAAYTGI